MKLTNWKEIGAVKSATITEKRNDILALKPAIIVAKFSVQLALKWICTIIKKNSVFVHKKNQGEYCVL